MQVPVRDRNKKPISRMITGLCLRGGCFLEHSKRHQVRASNWNPKFYIYCILTTWISEKARVQPHPITTSHSDGLNFHLVEENVMRINCPLQGNPALLSSKGRWERMATPLRWTWSSRTTAAPLSDTTWSSTERWVASFPSRHPRPRNPDTPLLMQQAACKAQARRGGQSHSVGPWSGF